jgi:hypothetical protein
MLNVARSQLGLAAFSFIVSQLLRRMRYERIMTQRRTDQGDGEGFRFEAPFVSVQFGRFFGRWEMMEQDDAYERARQRVHARLSFYRHLATYAAVIFAIGFIDLVTGGGFSTITAWIAGIWGGFIVWQAFNVFVFPSIWNRETEERMIQDELRKQRESSP